MCSNFPHEIFFTDLTIYTSVPPGSLGCSCFSTRSIHCMYGNWNSLCETSLKYFVSLFWNLCKVKLFCVIVLFCSSRPVSAIEWHDHHGHQLQGTPLVPWNSQRWKQESGKFAVRTSLPHFYHFFLPHFYHHFTIICCCYGKGWGGRGMTLACHSWWYLNLLWSQLSALLNDLL